MATRHLAAQNYPQVMEFIEAARKMAAKLAPNADLKARLYMAEGDCFKATDKPKESYEAYKNATIFFKESKNIPLLIYATLGVGDSFANQEKYEEAITTYQEASTLIEQHQPLKQLLMIEILEKVAGLHVMLDQFEQAEEKYRKAWNLVKKTNNLSVTRVNNILLALSLHHFDNDNIKKAKIWWKIAQLTMELDFPQDKTLESEFFRIRQLFNINQKG